MSLGLLSNNDALGEYVSVSPRGFVAADGSYQQTVPVSVPPFHGLEPAVGLALTSSAERSVIGRGWSLIGATKIMRVRNRVGLAHLDESDQFSLDGNLLIPCARQIYPGVSCASGGNYGLENETYQRVVREGADWLVTDRTGVMTRFHPLSPTGTLDVQWLPTDREDPHGNHLSFDYWCDGTEECYIKQIVYDDAKDPLKRTRIEYHWETRPDPWTYSMERTDLVTVRQRLHAIIVWTNNAARNALAVRYTPTIFGRWNNESLVRALVRYGNDVTIDATGHITGGTGSPPETASYEPDGGLSPLEPISLPSGASPNPSNNLPWQGNDIISDIQWSPLPVPGMTDPKGSQNWLAVDVNGDGLSDMVTVVHTGNQNPGPAAIVVQINRGDGTLRPATRQRTPWQYWLPSGTRLPRGHFITSGDFDGDGLSDLLATWADAAGALHMQIARSLGTGAFVLTTEATPPLTSWSNDGRWLTGDIDGDGRDDLIVVEGKVQPSGFIVPIIHSFRSSGLGLIPLQSLEAPWTWLVQDLPYWFTGDQDGDGRDDIIRVESEVYVGPSGNVTRLGARIGLARSDGNGFFAFSTQTTGIRNWNPKVVLQRWRAFSPAGSDLAKIGDFDGNGLVDIVLFEPAPANAVVDVPHLKSTAMLSQPSGGYLRKQQDLTLGVARQNNYSSFADSPTTRWLAGDVNRDGATDLMIVTPPNTGATNNWPQETLVITLTATRDGGFVDEGTQAARRVTVSFDCWERAVNLNTCLGGPDFDVVPAELNGDGESDLLFVRFNQPGDHVVLRFEPTPPSDPADIGWSFADVNGDGRLDFIRLSPANTSIAIQSMIAPGASNPQWTLKTDTITAVRSIGLDRRRWLVADVGSPHGTMADGKADFVLIHSDLSGTGPIAIKSMVLLSNGDGTFAPSASQISSTSVDQSAFLWRTGDFNGDGATDLARIAPKGGDLEWLTAKGGGHWIPHRLELPSISRSPVATATLLVGDVDGDARDDLILPNSGTDPAGTRNTQIIVLRSEPEAHATQVYFDTLVWQTNDLNLPMASWRTAEMNGDGKVDLGVVVTDPLGVQVYELLNINGGASWLPQAPWTSSELFAAQATIHFADANADNCTDVAWVHNWFGVSPKLVWTLNRCDGSFYDINQFEVGLRSGSASTVNWQVADLDGDRRSDVIGVTKTPRGISARGARSTFPRPLIVGFDNGLGLSTAIRYGSSAGIHAPGPFGSPRTIVSSLEGMVFPSTSTRSQTRFSYTGARWSSRTRKFVGFSEVIALDNATQTRTAYAQSDGCRYQPLQTSVENVSGVFWQDFRKYSDNSTNLSLPTAPWRCQLSQQWRERCELGPCRSSSMQEFKYDEFGNVIETTVGELRTTRVIFHPNVQKWIVSLPAEVVTTGNQGMISAVKTLYDGASTNSAPPQKGDPTSIEIWDSLTGSYLLTQREFDLTGNEITLRDAEGRTVETEWDGEFRRYPIKQCNAVWCTSKEWDVVLGVPLTETDQNLVPTIHHYDPLGRIVRTDFADGGCIRWAYLDIGVQYWTNQKVEETRCLRHTNGETTFGLSHSFYFDGLQRIWKEDRSGLYERRQLFYGLTSRLRMKSNWREAGSPLIWTQYAWDDAGRLVRTILPDGQMATIEYLTDGEIEHSPGGGRTETKLDKWGRVTSVAEDVVVAGTLVTAVTTYGYDALDRLIKAVDANGSTTTWEVSSLGWQYKQCSPDSGCVVRRFDRTGLEIGETNDAGDSITYVLDPIGRIVERRATNATGISDINRWTYDYDPNTKPDPFSKGRIVSVENTSGSKQHSVYDALGRTVQLKTCIASNCAMIGMSWDLGSRLQQVQYPDSTGALSAQSEVAVYRYDTVGRVSDIAGYVDTVQYTPDDHISHVHFGNGVEQSFQYDRVRHLMESASLDGFRAANGNWTSAVSHYEYGPDGYVTSEMRAGPTSVQRSFAYDPSGRLLQVTGADADLFEYDLVGNIKSRKSLGRYLFEETQSPNRVTSLRGLAYRYDAAGRMIARGRDSFSWDALGRLTQIVGRRGTTNLSYYADGTLASITTPSGPARLFFGNWAEQDSTQGLTINIVLNGMVIAQKNNISGVRYFHHDRLGSVAEITNQGGHLLESYGYTPWGESKALFGLDNDRRFTEGREDRSSGLILLGARALDPLLARFTSPDPIIPDAMKPSYLNRYLYARDNPLNVTDPSGMEPSDERPSISDVVIGQLKRALEPLNEKQLWLGPMPQRSESAIPHDPVDALISLALDPWVPFLKYGPFREASKGVALDYNGGLCVGFCFLVVDVQVGLFGTPPSARDAYFNDLHPFLSIGGSFLGVSLHSGADIAAPLKFTTASGEEGPIQINPGLAMSYGFSALGFLSQTQTADDFSDMARNVSGGAGPMSVGLSQNAAGQMTASAGFGVSAGLGIQTYNSYTMIPRTGLLSTIRRGIGR